MLIRRALKSSALYSLGGIGVLAISHIEAVIRILMSPSGRTAPIVYSPGEAAFILWGFPWSVFILPTMNSLLIPDRLLFSISRMLMLVGIPNLILLFATVLAFGTPRHNLIRFLSRWFSRGVASRLAAALVIGLVVILAIGVFVAWIRIIDLLSGN